MILTAQVHGWLVAAAGMLPDTVVTRASVPGLTWFSTVITIAVALVALLLLALLVVGLTTARRLGTALTKAEALLDRVHADLPPVLQHAGRVADNVEYITAAVRADVQDVSRTLRHANDRVNDALVASEHRLRELGALVQLAQTEIEHAIVATGAAMRGVRAGAAAFQEDAEALLMSEDELDELEDLEESDDDGDDDARDEGHGRRTPAREGGGPRIRRHRDPTRGV